MRPQVYRMTADGASPWFPMNRHQTPFNVSVFGHLDDGSTLTWEVQHSHSRLDFDAQKDIRISRSTTTATVEFREPHGLNDGDSLIVRGSGDSNLDGDKLVTVTDSDTVTYTVADTGATASVPGCTGLCVSAKDHATLTGQTTSADGNYAFPVTAIRFQVSGYSAGAFTGTILQGS